MTTIALPSTRSTSRATPHLVTAARILLGLVFLGSGLAGLLLAPPKLTTPPTPEGVIALFEGMVRSGYLLKLLKLTETAVGILLLANRFVPLALAILGPVVLNIVAFHVFLMPSGLPVALAVLALELYLAWSYRERFLPMLAARATPGRGEDAP